MSTSLLTGASCSGRKKNKRSITSAVGNGARLAALPSRQCRPSRSTGSRCIATARFLVLDGRAFYGIRPVRLLPAAGRSGGCWKDGKLATVGLREAQGVAYRLWLPEVELSRRNSGPPLFESGNVCSSGGGNDDGPPLSSSSSCFGCGSSSASRRIKSIHAQVAETALAPLHRRVKEFRQFGRRQVARHGREESVGIVGRVVRLGVAGQHIRPQQRTVEFDGRWRQRLGAGRRFVLRHQAAGHVGIDGRFLILVSECGAARGPSFVDWYHDDGFFGRRRKQIFFFFWWKRRIERTKLGGPESIPQLLAKEDIGP